MTDLLDDTPTTFTAYPRYDGANIRIWMGFKQFMALVEESVLHWFRERGFAASELLLSYGLGLEIVDSSLQLPVALQLDELVTATVVAGKQKTPGAAPFNVTLAVQRDGAELVVGRAKVTVALITLKHMDPPQPVPSALEPFTVPEAAALPNRARTQNTALDGRTPAEVLGADPANFVWSWRVPYFYCHFSDRLQHSGYTRAMEEVVDRYLNDRGMSIRTMLEERAWIPVVSRSRVQVLADVYMEETVHTVFRIEDFLREMAYSARMDSYVERDGELVHVGTGTIMHGYAISRGPQAGSVAVLDEAVQAELIGGRK